MYFDRSGEDLSSQIVEGCGVDRHAQHRAIVGPTTFMTEAVCFQLPPLRFSVSLCRFRSLRFLRSRCLRALCYTPIMNRPGRNDPCHCGSGRKYKHCCLEKDAAAASAERAKTAAEAPAPAAPEAAHGPHAPQRKAETHQPWRASTRGFIPRTRMPRKVGGS
jgi:SEC-C motif-containing protein